MTIKNDNAKFIGTWKGGDKGEIMHIGFDSEGYVYIEFEGKNSWLKRV